MAEQDERQPRQTATRRATSAPKRTTAGGAKKTTARTTTRATATKQATATKATKGAGSAAATRPVRRTGNLVIVESPSKAKTIAKYLGPGYRVQASMGHVRDLPKSKLGVDVEHDFTPQYLISKDKTQVVKDLKSSVQGAGQVFLATDPDREGEAIAWHLIEATTPDPARVHRVVFHEITPGAVRAAIANPRAIDMHLVDAQQARRVLDRLVGYKVSPLLWRKVKSGLSAGRVQTAALRLIVEREREIEAFVPVEYWTIEADLAKQASGPEPNPADQFRATLHQIAGKKAELHNETEATAVITDLNGAAYIVREVKTRETQRRPAAPFITSTLQQEASRKLGYGVRRTMQLAQELYEGVDLGPEGTVGLITYMRTDSTNIAAVAQEEARTIIAAKYGADYVPEKPPVYSRKAKGAQEAHEAIRPSGVARDPEAIRGYLSPQQYRLYRLIWQRFVASQMRPALLDSTTVDIDAGRGILADRPASQTAPYVFRATGAVIKFQGFLAVYREGRDDNADDDLDKDALPLLTRGEPLDLIRLAPEQHFTQPPPRFTEASLVKSLEEEGIGRPSTYAATVATLQTRFYVEVEEKRLKPTDLGRVVNDILVEQFPAVFDIGFTSKMEEELDEIAAGERPWVPVLQAFYGPFAESVEKAEGSMGRVKVADEPTDEVCELCGRPMVIKLGRFGKFMACTGFPECRNTKNIAQGTGVTCPKCGKHEIVVKRSRKGGRVFYGCNGYPDCDFTLWDRPLPTPCPACGGLMVEAGKRGSGAKCTVCGNTSRTAATKEMATAD
ncbi:MAG TPA: type I DNA topoisomerase [Thermomicrobiales bacterium]|jgi:DNA topoisomerase-1|nr:type I DNA topoisomerase [Thermomicrobiales bacterium]